jgi:dihydrofolate reductase
MNDIGCSRVKTMNDSQKVFFSMGMSLDGFIAGPNASPENPMGDGGGENLHKWLFTQKVFRENLGLGEGGETGKDNEIAEAIMKRPGAGIMGEKMFKEGEVAWPENAPFRTPVFVLTKERRQPWERPGGTTFYFVSDSIESVLQQAKEAADGKDVQIHGGANAIQQYLNAGLVDEFMVHYSPVFLGTGSIPLFANINPDIKINIVETVASPNVTHVTYAVEAMPKVSGS